MANRIPTTLALLAVTAMAGSALIPAPAAAQPCVPPPGLTGHWFGNDKGDYYIRQMGNVVVWVGLDSATGGAGWTHMFRGTRTGNIIRGPWADVRGNVGSGVLVLQVQGPRMKRTYTSNSNFGGSSWVKRCN